MPSSFKRREPGQAKAQAQLRQVGVDSTLEEVSTTTANTAVPHPASNLAAHPLPSGLRPCPFPSPVALFSTGLASLDDLICGHGVPSASLIVFCPAVGLTSISAEAGFGGGATVTDAQHITTSAAAHQRRALQTTSRITIEALQAAEQTLIDLMAYGIAQGVVADHRLLIIGQQARELVTTRVPSLATTSRSGVLREKLLHEPAQADKVGKDDVRGQGNRDEQLDIDDTMTIAFRYAHRPKFKTTVDEPSAAREAHDIAPEHRFRAPFDMNKPLAQSHVEALEADTESGGGIRIVESTRYDEAISIIEQEARLCLSARASEPRPLRIHLVSLGSSAWSRASDSMDRRIAHMSRFLLRLRRLVRYLVLERQQDDKQALQVLCSVSVSPALLIAPWRTLVTQHLLRFFDVQVLLSDFSRDEQLKRAYGDYGGSVCLLKGPSIGSLLPHGEHRSILRGGGGDAGVENDVGWRRRKRGKGLVLETLHEDVDAVPADARPTEGAKRSGAGNGGEGEDIEESAAGLPRRRGATSLSGVAHSHPSDENGAAHRHQRPVETVQLTSRLHRKESQTEPAVEDGPASTVGPLPRFQGGLKSLRERGLRAAANKQIEVRVGEVNDGKDDVPLAP